MKNLTLKRVIRRIKPETLIWILQGYQMPAPFHVKIKTLKRYSTPKSDWIETGTYLAETTLKLAQQNIHNQIYTIEPAEEIYAFVNSKYSKIPNLNFLHGTSEELFEGAMLKCGTEINFWLDGHYSGDITFKGAIDSPISHELSCIAQYASKFKSIRVFIDDFRLFGNATGYPSKEFLADWAESNNFTWTVENDIFIAMI